MLNPCLTYSKSFKSYLYSFNGFEKDDEVKGEGNSYNYEYRMADPRLGRFLSVDPLAAKYAYNSPYAFCENRVIDGIELEGLEYVRADATVSKDVQNEDGSYTKTESTFGAEFGDLYEMVQIDGVDYYNVGRDFYKDSDGYVHLHNTEGTYDLLSEFPAASEVWDRPLDSKYMNAFVPYAGSLPQCFDYACASAGKLGNPTGPGYWLWSIQMSNPESTKGLAVTAEGQQEGSYFINKALEKNTTVVVGLNYQKGDGGAIRMERQIILFMLQLQVGILKIHVLTLLSLIMLIYTGRCIICIGTGTLLFIQMQQLKSLRWL